VEDQISQRKAEVEKLIKEMREANMESLAISPPEESKQFLDGNCFFPRNFLNFCHATFRSSFVPRVCGVVILYSFLLFKSYIRTYALFSCQSPILLNFFRRNL
jgi:hypothetical protein